MKAISCLLVDDDNSFAENLIKEVDTFSFMKIATHCTSYSEALAALRHHNYELVILDIYLNGQDGMTGFDLLRHVPNLPPIIIVSYAPENAVESYTVGKAIDFLVKPFTPDRFLLAVNRALAISKENLLSLDKNVIFFKTGRRLHKFHLNDIDYIEGYGVYAKVITDGGVVHIINESMSTVEENLKHHRFLRIHKSYIINLEKIIAYDHNTFFLKNGSVPIGAAYKPKLNDLFHLFDKEAKDTL